MKARKLEEKAQKQVVKQALQAVKAAELEAKKAAKQALKPKSKPEIAVQARKKHIVVDVDNAGSGVPRKTKMAPAQTCRTRTVVVPARYCKTT